MKCLNGRLDYNPETGIFIWLIAPQGKKVGQIAGGSKSNSYVRIKSDGKLYQAHRLAWDCLNPENPLRTGEEIDHIDHNRTNNSASNLRKVSAAENMRNKSPYKKNRYAANGVDNVGGPKPWRARIRLDGNLLYLGCFLTKEDAISARREAEGKLGFHQNHGEYL